MLKKLATVMVVLMVGLFAADAAVAQEVGVSYSFLRMTADGDFDGLSMPMGLSASVAMPIRDSLSVVGDIGWNRKTDDFDSSIDTTMSVLTVLGGLRYAKAAEQWTPFCQVLAGIERGSADIEDDWDDFIEDTSETGFALQPGVGVDYKLNESTSLRGQFDYRFSHYEGGWDDSYRLSAGVVFGFGK